MEFFLIISVGTMITRIHFSCSIPAPFQTTSKKAKICHVQPRSPRLQWKTSDFQRLCRRMDRMQWWVICRNDDLPCYYWLQIINEVVEYTGIYVLFNCLILYTVFLLIILLFMLWLTSFNFNLFLHLRIVKVWIIHI